MSELPPFSLDELRKQLAQAAAADKARRVVCPVDGYRTADIERHRRLHGLPEEGTEVKLEDRTELVQFLREMSEAYTTGDRGRAKLAEWIEQLETVTAADKVYAVHEHYRDSDNYPASSPINRDIVYASREAAEAANPGLRWTHSEPRGSLYWHGMYSIEEVEVRGFGDEEDS
jgi:hypothetical protein